MRDTIVTTAAAWLIVAFAGCDRRTFDNDSTEITPAALERAWARSSAAAAVTSIGTGNTPPSPPPAEPTPEPGGLCGRCQGSGRIKPNGRIEIDCPDCAGDGKLSYGDMLAVVRNWQAFRIPPAEIRNTHKPTPELTALEPTPPNEHSLLAPQKVAPLKPAPIKIPTVQWLISLESARKAARQNGKPALVYWYSERCQPCRAFERVVLGDLRVQEVLASRMVCVKIDAERLNQAAAGRRRLQAWNIVSIPHVSIATPDWKTSTKIKQTNDPGQFIDDVNEGLQWSATQLRNNPTRAASTKHVSRSHMAAKRTPVRTANWQSVVDDLYSVQSDSAASIPLESPIQIWRPTSARVQQLQYGSNGGSGAYRIVLMKGSQAANGATYPTEYGWNGGTATYGAYHTQPTLYQLPVYYQPTYYRTAHGAGRTMVCGPWGCVLQ
jgi:hypothetical protein